MANQEEINIKKAIEESLKKVEEQTDSDLQKATENSVTSAEIDLIEKEQIELVKKMSVDDVKDSKELNVGFSVSGLLATHYKTTIIIPESTTMDEIIEKSLLKLYEYVKKIEKESGIHCLRENYENLFKKDKIKLHCHDYNSSVVWLCYHPEECDKSKSGNKKVSESDIEKMKLELIRRILVESKEEKINGCFNVLIYDK